MEQSHPKDNLPAPASNNPSPIAMLTGKKRRCGKRVPFEQKLAIRVAHDAGKTYRQLQKEHDVSQQTIATILHDKELEIVAPDKLERLKNGIKSRLYLNAARAQVGVTDDKLLSMNAYQLTMISAVNIDKARLMEGLSTENVSHRGLIENLEVDRQKLEARIKNLGIVDNQSD